MRSGLVRDEETELVEYDMIPNGAVQHECWKRYLKKGRATSILCRSILPRYVILSCEMVKGL